MHRFTGLAAQTLHACGMRVSLACMYASVHMQVLKFLESEVMQVMHYGMNVKGTTALAAALRVNQNLRVLRLTDNAIPDEGIKVLCDVSVGACGICM